MTSPIGTPDHHPETEPVPLTPLVHRWQSARWRLHLTDQRGAAPDPADLLAELRAGARIADTVTSGRWWRVAALLCTGTIEPWARVADALDMSEGDALEQFALWLGGQARQFEATGRW